jgi:hypothetical protein
MNPTPLPLPPQAAYHMVLAFRFSWSAMSGLLFQNLQQALITGLVCCLRIPSHETRSKSWPLPHSEPWCRLIERVCYGTYCIASPSQPMPDPLTYGPVRVCVYLQW